MPFSAFSHAEQEYPDWLVLYFFLLSVNIYMFHGGTSFGFTAGSNYFHSSAGGFQVTPTRSEILQLHSGIQIWPITLPCHIIAMTTTLRWVRLETWQKSGGQSGRWSAGEVSRFMGFRGFMGSGDLTKTWSEIQELLPAPTGLVIEHVQIFFSNEI